MENANKNLRDVVRNTLLYGFSPWIAEKMVIDRKKAGRKIARPFWVGLFFDAVFCAFEGCL